MQDVLFDSFRYVWSNWFSCFITIVSLGCALTVAKLFERDEDAMHSSSSSKLNSQQISTGPGSSEKDSGEEVPTPRWAWFQICNYVALLTFIISVSAILNQRNLRNHTWMNPVSVISFLCAFLSLGYLLAFFGVNFASQFFEEEQQQFDLKMHNQRYGTHTYGSVNGSNRLSDGKSGWKPYSIYIWKSLNILP